MSGEVIPCDNQGLSGSEPGGAQPQGLGFDSPKGWRTKRGLRGIEERVRHELRSSQYPHPAMRIPDS